jgi:hypothetical protein
MRRVDINSRERRLAPGVDEAWVANPLARRADPADVAASGELPANIRECLAAMPDSIRNLDALVAAVRAAGAPAVVRIFPGPDGHGYPLEPWAVSPIPEYCEREDLALAIDFGDAGPFPWRDVVAFARAYPRLTIVAHAAPFAGPTLRRALDAASNLIFDTSGLAGSADPLALAALVRSHGAHRVAYGSGGSAVAAAEIAAALDGSDAEMVMSGVAARLDKGTWGSDFL